MKVILKFELPFVLEFELPEDQDDLTLALKGRDWYLVSWDLDQWLRGKLKYGGYSYKTPQETLEAVREELRGIISSRGLSMEDVA